MKAEHYYVTLLTPAIILTIVIGVYFGGWESFIFLPISLLYTSIAGSIIAKKLCAQQASNAKIFLLALLVVVPVLVVRLLIPVSSDNGSSYILF